MSTPGDPAVSTGPQAVLAEIERRGLRITAAGGDLKLAGPRELIDTDLVGRIRAVKPELIAYLDGTGPVELTPLQRGYLFGRSEIVELGGVASHVYHEIEGVWDVERLERALRSVVDAHAGLRHRFTAEGLQEEVASATVRIPVRDLRTLPVRARAERRLALRERLSHRLLPLDRAPLVAAQVTILADDRMVLHVGHDGLVMDGISMFLFFRAWSTAYDQAARDEPGDSVAELPYRDYVKALAAARDKAPAQRSKAYWLDRVDELAPHPDLPLATSPSAVTRPRFRQRLARLGAADWTALKERAAAAGVTPTGVLLCAYAETLANWGAGERFTIVTTIANRPPIHPRAFDAIGQFSDTMLVEVGADRLTPFGDRARALQAQLHKDIDNRHFSGVEVLRELGRRGDAARLPYTFNSAIGYVRSGVDGSALELFGPEVFSVSQTPQVWLNVFAMEQHGGLVVQVDAVDELFPAGLLDALVGAYQELLERLRDPAAWAQPHFDLLPADQRDRRDAANDTEVEQPSRLLPESFAEHALRDPDAPAVIAGDRVMTYGELHRRASYAAAWLREHGVGPGELVGLVMNRGPEQVVGILATALAGAAYLPVDANLPAERRAYMLRDGDVRRVLTNAPDTPAAPDGPAVETLVVDATRPPETDTPVAVEPVGGPDDLAYVLYTSGTTGQPKGVMVSRRSVANVVADCTARFGVTAADRFFGISAFNFDLSVYDVFGALGVGAAIVLPDAERAVDPAHWLELVARHEVTLWNSVPAIVGLLQEQAAGQDGGAGQLASLRLVMMSGDRVPPGLPAALLRLRPDLEVISLGGPTETTIWNILHPIDAADDGSRSIPYGGPNANNRAYVLDAVGLDAPDWVAGEICAGGVGLAQGYWGDAERTADRFWLDERRGERLYRTGDLGRYLPSGEIEILGRSDFQIKVNGYRIEAGEVETRLVAIGAVKQAAVVRQAAARGDRLVAHLAAAGDARPGIDEIRGELRVHLPDYMIPSAVVWHDALPLTRNGKVDRGKLVATEVAEAPATTPAPAVPPPVAAPSDVEEQLRELWRSILKVPDVALDASFYDLGGDSLAAARVLTDVRKRFAVTIPLDQLYEVRTVRAMAARIGKGK